MLSYAFISRALIVGLLVSLCCALLGVNLVLKKYSMIGDGLSHVSFGSLAVAIALNASPLEFSIPIVIIAAFFLLKIGDNSKIKGDAAIALISSTALAIGIMAVSINGGVNIDINSYMFGSILAVTKSDVFISVLISIIVIISYFFFYHKIFAITFDEDFAKAIGVKVNIYKMLLAISTALTIVIGMRIVGTLLISSLIIFPALTSMRVCKTFKSVVVLSTFISIISFSIGFSLSFVHNIPVGASIVLVNVCFFLLSYLIGYIVKVN
jgi:zinc transport system permease protein